MQNYILYIMELLDTIKSKISYKRFLVESFTSYEIMNNLFMTGLASLIVAICGLLLMCIQYSIFVYLRVEESLVYFELNSVVGFSVVGVVVSIVIFMLMHLFYGFTNLFLDYLHNVKIRRSLWLLIEVCFISMLWQAVAFLIFSVY